MERLTVVQALRRAFPEVSLVEFKSLAVADRRELAELAAKEIGFELVESVSA